MFNVQNFIDLTLTLTKKPYLDKNFEKWIQNHQIAVYKNDICGLGNVYLFPSLINYVINLQVVTVISKMDIKTSC